MQTRASYVRVPAQRESSTLPPARAGEGSPATGTVYVRRRGSLVQGRALETLGHAVEYLIDSGMFARDASDGRSNQEAVQILMRLSRCVFEECPEVIPVRHKLGRWCRHLMLRALRSS